MSFIKHALWKRVEQSVQKEYLNTVKVNHRDQKIKLNFIIIFRILRPVVVHETTFSKKPLVGIVLLSVILFHDKGYEHVLEKSQEKIAKKK